MSRLPRKLSQTGLYHILFRGMNHCHLFEEENDYIKLIKVLSDLKEENDFEIYAYCFMSNHVHLLIKERNTGDITTIMRRLLTKYAGWFNRKYQRSGSLIANRYKSECVEVDEYLINLIRYIHQNPIKAGIVEQYENYKWSSYLEYTNLKTEIKIIDKEFILDMFHEKNAKKAVRAFIEYHAEEERKNFEITNRKRLTEEEIHHRLKESLNGAEPNSIAKLPRAERNEKLRSFREMGFSIRQIERATGISRGVIAKC